MRPHEAMYLLATDRRHQLLQLLSTCYQFSCTDARDRVYALQHIAADYINGNIEVDYGATLSEVYVSALRCHIKRHRNLSFLCHARLRNQANKRNNWTSWIPDFATPRADFKYLYSEDLLQEEFLYEAVSDDSMTLSVAGVMLHTLKHVGHGFPTKTTLLKVKHHYEHDLALRACARVIEYSPLRFLMAVKFTRSGLGLK